MYMCAIRDNVFYTYIRMGNVQTQKNEYDEMRTNRDHLKHITNLNHITNRDNLFDKRNIAGILKSK